MNKAPTQTHEGMGRGICLSLKTHAIENYSRSRRWPTEVISNRLSFVNDFSSSGSGRKRILINNLPICRVRGSTNRSYQVRSLRPRRGIFVVSSFLPPASHKNLINLWIWLSYILQSVIFHLD